MSCRQGLAGRASWLGQAQAPEEEPPRARASEGPAESADPEGERGLGAGLPAVADNRWLADADRPSSPLPAGCRVQLFSGRAWRCSAGASWTRARRRSGLLPAKGRRRCGRSRRSSRRRSRVKRRSGRRKQKRPRTLESHRVSWCAVQLGVDNGPGGPESYQGNTKMGGLRKSRSRSRRSRVKTRPRRSGWPRARSSSAWRTKNCGSSSKRTDTTFTVQRF